MAALGAETMSLYENWVRDQQAAEDLERYYGLREPTYDELAQEAQDRQDRISDFSPVAAASGVKRPEPAPSPGTPVPALPAPVPPLPPLARTDRGASPTQED